MKNRMVAMACALLSPVLFGQPPQKIGVIQIQSAMISTRDGQKAVVELNTKMEPRKKGIEKKASDIRELQDKLQRGGPAMSETSKQELTRQIDALTKNYNRDMQDAQDEYEQENRKVLSGLSEKMTKVIDKYAVDNHYSIILDVSNPNTPVMYISNTVDITREIIELYDKTLPAPDAPKPANPKPAVPKPASTTPAPAPKKQP